MSVLSDITTARHSVGLQCAAAKDADRYLWYIDLLVHRIQHVYMQYFNSTCQMNVFATGFSSHRVLTTRNITFYRSMLCRALLCCGKSFLCPSVCFVSPWSDRLNFLKIITGKLA